MKKMDLEKVKAYIDAQSPETSVYLGCDSERVKVDGVWYADYALAVVVHIDSCHGCKIFGEVQRERDWDQRSDKPSMRLMNEVYKVSELFQKMSDVLEDRLVEVHVDFNQPIFQHIAHLLEQFANLVDFIHQSHARFVAALIPIAFSLHFTKDLATMATINMHNHSQSIVCIPHAIYFDSFTIAAQVNRSFRALSIDICFDFF